MTKPNEVKIEIERRDGLVFATSPDMRGLLVSGRSEEEVRASVPGAISAMRIAEIQTRRNTP